MKPVTFNPMFDLVFDWDGVSHQPSGTAPYNPNQVRVVIQNCETTKVNEAMDKECTAAVDVGEAALKSFIRANFKPQGERAVRQWGYRMDDDNA